MPVKWCLNNSVEVNFVLKNSQEGTSSSFFKKIVAMLEKWKEFICPLKIEINNYQIFKGSLFFENVCKGWHFRSINLHL